MQLSEQALKEVRNLSNNELRKIIQSNLNEEILKLERRAKYVRVQYQEWKKELDGIENRLSIAKQELSEVSSQLK